MFRGLNKKKLDQIKKDSFESSTSFVKSADQWLRSNDVITDYFHNAILVNLYVHFPRAKYIEYYLDPENQEIEIYFHFSKLAHFFQSESRIEKKARKLLFEYIPKYSISIRKRIYTGTPAE